MKEKGSIRFSAGKNIMTAMFIPSTPNISMHVYMSLLAMQSGALSRLGQPSTSRYSQVKPSRSRYSQVEPGRAMYTARYTVSVYLTVPVQPL